MADYFSEKVFVYLTIVVEIDWNLLEDIGLARERVNAI